MVESRIRPRCPIDVVGQRDAAPHTHGRHRTAWRAVAASILPLSACAPSSSADPSDSQVPSFYSVSYSYDEAELLYRAEGKVVSECMAARGFPEFRLPAFVPSLEIARGSDRRWGITDPAEASVRGYHEVGSVQAISDRAMKEMASETAFYDSMQPERRDAYFLALDGSAYGVSRPEVATVTATIPGSDREFTVQLAGRSDSCLRSIPLALGEDAKTYEALQAAIGRAAADVDSIAASDDAFTTSLESWSNCFKERGFDSETPLDALDAYTAPGLDPSESEIAAATADIACKNIVGLTETWRKSVKNAEVLVGSEIVPEIEYWREVRGDIIERARQLLADDVPPVSVASG